MNTSVYRLFVEWMLIIHLIYGGNYISCCSSHLCRNSRKFKVAKYHQNILYQLYNLAQGSTLIDQIRYTTDNRF